MQIRPDVYLKSVGSYLPDPVSVDSAIADGLYNVAALDICRLTGTHIAGDQAPAEMTVSAVRTTLDRAGLTAADLDHFMFSSVFQPGPNGWSLPGYVLDQLGGGEAPVLELRTGCSGMLSAIEFAAGQITGVAGAKDILIAGADNFTPTLDRWSSYAFIAGDGASAMVVSADSGFARVLSVNSRTVPGLEAMQRGNEPLFRPEGNTGKVDEQGRLDHFSEHVMPAIDAASIMAEVHLDLTKRTVDDAGVQIGDITRVAYHHMSEFVVKQFVVDPLDLPLERSCFEFGASAGHLGVSDQVVSLEHLLLSGELAPGDLVLLIGGSAGFASCAVLLEILDIPAWAR